jgi:hypothetical protein
LPALDHGTAFGGGVEGSSVYVDIWKSFGLRFSNFLVFSQYAFKSIDGTIEYGVTSARNDIEKSQLGQFDIRLVITNTKILQWRKKNSKQILA